VTKPLEGILVQGVIEEVLWDFQHPRSTRIRLFGFRAPLAIPAFIPRLQVADRLCAVCYVDDQGEHVVVDLITSANQRPISRQQRDALFARLGVRAVYEAPRPPSSKAVLASLSEIEVELVTYLAKHPELMHEIDPQAFEKLVAELMAAHGFCVEWTGRDKSTAADVIAFRRNALGLQENYIVECKRYSRDRAVSIEVARALYGAKVDEGFANALLVTTSRFQRGVEEFALKRWDLHLVAFRKLLEWLNRYSPREDGKLYMDENRLFWTQRRSAGET